jgi:hypothetical protein
MGEQMQRRTSGNQRDPMTQTTCPNDAAYRYIWPSDGEHFICEQHFPKLKAVAEAMGLHIAVSRLQEPTEQWCPPRCDQKVKS